MIMLFFERGSDIKKMANQNKSKMSARGRTTCGLFETQYKLVAKGARAASDILTLPRIAMAFPIQACMYSKFRVSWPVQPVNLTGDRPVIACQTLGALIPTESMIDMTPLIKSHGWFQYRLSMLINNKNFERKTVTERKEETMNFIALSMKSKLPYSTETKMTFLRNRGILNSLKVFHHEIVRYSQKWDANDFVFDPPTTAMDDYAGINPSPPGSPQGPTPGPSGLQQQTGGSGQTSESTIVRLPPTTSKSHTTPGAVASHSHPK